MRIFKSLIAACIVVYCISCNTSDKQPIQGNTPTSGALSVAVDDAYTNLFKAFKEAFEHTYPNAQINIKYVTEAEAVAAFRNGEVPLIGMSRQLTEDEMKEMKERGYYIKVLPFAADAIAFITNEKHDSLYTEQEMLQILQYGSISSGNKNIAKQDTIRVVFDKNNTGTASYLRDSILKGAPLGKNCYALSSVDEVFEYVRTNTTAIGVIGVNHISDRYDDSIRQALSGLRIIAVSKKETPKNFVKPSPEHIQDGSYPFLRNIYLINGEGTNGLATGFAAYILSDIGMTIIEQIGLKPAKEPVRVIEIRKSFE